MTPEAVAHQYTKWANMYVPDRFRRAKTITAEGLAYGYETYKAKCFLAGKGTCTKAHNCCREIVSWVHWPYGAMMRKAGRAWQIILQRADRSTFELWSMKQVGHVIDERVDHLFAPPAWRCKCYRCKTPKAPIEFLVGDANRLYTSVSTEQVEEAAAAYRTEFERITGDERVSVLHTSRVKGYVGGNAHNSDRGTV